MKQLEILSKLQTMVNRHLEEARLMKQMPPALLEKRPGTGKWNALECLEHLSLYGDFYLPELEDKILKAPKLSGEKKLKTGWFAGRTVQSMLPNEDGSLPSTMNTFKDKNTYQLSISMSAIDRFIKQQERLLDLLKRAEKVDISGIRTRITLPVIKFRLGETLRFVIYHQERHMLQARKAMD